MSLGYLVCSFDLLNVGHLDLIDQARTLCGRLVVGIFSDAVVEQESGRPPVVPLVERVALVQHLRGVDEVVVHDVAPGCQGDALLMITEDDRSAAVAERSLELSTRRTTVSVVVQDAVRPVGSVTAQAVA